MVNAANLVLRFFLEILALVAAGYWGFTNFDSWPVRILAGLGVPLLMAAAWGIFRVPGDGGPPIVTVSGRVRLALKFVLFVVAVYLLALARRKARGCARCSLRGWLRANAGFPHPPLIRRLTRPTPHLF
jgi:uncharacterized protein DUF2568